MIVKSFRLLATCLFIITFALNIGTAFGATVLIPPPTFISDSLLKQGYIGAIRTPKEASSLVTIKDVYPPDGKFRDGMNYAGGPFAIDTTRNEFVFATRYGRVVRLKMVEPKLATKKTVNGTQVLDSDSYPVAPYVDGVMLDYSNNTWPEINFNNQTDGTGLGGFLPLNDKLFMMATVYYDAAYVQRRSITASEWPVTTVRSVSRTPWKTIGSPLKRLTENGGPVLDSSGNQIYVQPDRLQGHIAGPMAPIPAKWQTALKGDMLSGQSGLPIISRQCLGPCVFTYWSNDVLTMDQPPATLALGYVDGHGMPGHPWASPTPSDYFNESTAITGIAIVNDDIIFVGTHGYGPACYGKGTNNRSIVGTTDPIDGGYWCYDPLLSGKGTHAYPYRAQAWVYPVSAMVEIINGQRLPWDILPTIIKLDWLPIYPHPYYATDPDATPLLSPIGISYNETTKRLYIGVRAQDGNGYEPGPLVHVFNLGTGSSNSTPTPMPPPPTLPAAIPIAGDLNLDHTVNALDWSLMNSVWFTASVTSDLKPDGLVNSLDFAILSSNWGKTW